MIALWPIMMITFKEGIRNRALYAISLIALLLLAANFLISGMIPREIGKVAVDIALSTVSASGLLVVLFIGINLMAKDFDKRTVYMVLSRPISRSRYLIGKFFGLALLIVTMTFFLSLFAIVSIFVIKLSFPAYSLRISWPIVVLALSFIMLSLILLSAISFFFASFTTSSFTTLVLTAIVYVIGHSIGDVKTLIEASQFADIRPSAVAVKLIQITYYLFPNLSIFDIKMQAAHALSPTSSYIFWSLAYGVVYTALAITVAALIFRRRELP